MTQRQVPTLEWPQERTLLLDEEDSAAPEDGDGPLGADALSARPEDPAYVIYTSGSTGKPKGVQVPHRAVVNFLQSMAGEPGLTSRDRLLAVTTLSFDIAVTELLLPLAVGAEILIASREEAGDGVLLRRLIESKGVTVTQATPATWRMLVETGWAGSADFKVLCGGEALTMDLARQLTGRCGELWNMYGPTETTVWSTCCRIEADDLEQGITIGRPIANTTVWILDERLQTCPIGVPGEICIGGDGVTLGYLGRPELTDERFVADPFGWAPGARMYRTGDRGRFRGDGMLEHLGRMDFQVKVRGYRIELGEIEATLMTHADVSRAVVVTRQDNAADARLVAYFVPAAGRTPSDQSLREHLGASLPDYMLPQHFVAIGAIPLLPNGKVNRSALPAPTGKDMAGANRAEFVAPQGPIETRVVALMEEVLGIPGLGMTDDFFRLGGHSLLAARLIARLNRDLDLDLPMRAAFEHPTARRLVDAIEKTRQEGRTASSVQIERQPDQSRGPLTLSQARIRFVEEMHAGGVAYNLPSAHRLLGPMDVDAFDRALQEVVTRQAALRTIIVARGAEHEQRVLDHVECSLHPVEDLSALPAGEREPELMRRLEALIARPFDLPRGPLFATRLFRLGPDHHVFFFMAHHIIWDGWCFDLLYSEIVAAYLAALQGQRSALAAPEVSFIDFAHWQSRWLQGDACRAQMAFWRDHFDRAPAPGRIPTDFPRTPGMSGQGATEWLHVDREVVRGLRIVAQRADATLNMVTLAAYAAMLQQLADGGELILGIPMRGRSVPELESVVGFFNNLLPLRFHADASMSFVDWVRQVKRRLLDAFGHQDVPFELLVQEIGALRDAGSSGYYQALFSYQDARERLQDWGGLEHRIIPVFQGGATEDLGLWLKEEANELAGGVTYNTDLFAPATAVLWRVRYARLLERIAARPDDAIAQLLDTGDEERAALEQDLDATGSTHVLDLLDARRAGCAQAPALQWNERTVTHAQLAALTEAIASQLHSQAPAARRVGVQVADPTARVAAWLAVWRSGATCVMSAGNLDVDGLKTLDAVISDGAGGGASRLVIEAQAPPGRVGGTASAVRGLERDPSGPAIEFVSAAGTADVSHAALASLVRAMNARLQCGIGTPWLVGESMPDPAVAFATLAALVNDGLAVFVDADGARDGEGLRAIMAAARPQVVQLAPSSWRALLDARWAPTTPVTVLADAVETSPELAAELIQAGCRVRLMHRPAGLEIPVAVGDGASPGDPAHAGMPLLRDTIGVLDERGRLVPVGVAGRLAVQLGPAAARWIAGEAVRLRADGGLAVQPGPPRLATLDGQRVDLGELEAVVKADAAVAECVATVLEERPGDRRLHLYLVPAGGIDVDPVGVRTRVGPRLPRGVRVDGCTVLTAIPRLDDGNPDRTALAARVSGRATERPLPSTPTEVALAEVWSGLLGIQQIELRDNFFDLGGSSLLAMQAVEQMAARTGLRITPRRYVFETLAQLAKAYDSEPSPDAAMDAAQDRRDDKPGLWGRLGGLLKRTP